MNVDEQERELQNELLHQTRPKHPVYENYNTRLSSYKYWPQERTGQEPTTLADAGLFYCGFSDCVRCFWCGGGLTKWDSRDQPFEEHNKWYPCCKYVRDRRPDLYVADNEENNDHDHDDNNHDDNKNQTKDSSLKDDDCFTPTISAADVGPHTPTSTPPPPSSSPSPAGQYGHGLFYKPFTRPFIPPSTMLPPPPPSSSLVQQQQQQQQLPEKQQQTVNALLTMGFSEQSIHDAIKSLERTDFAIEDVVTVILNTAATTGTTNADTTITTTTNTTTNSIAATTTNSQNSNSGTWNYSDSDSDDTDSDNEDYSQPGNDQDLKRLTESLRKQNTDLKEQRLCKICLKKDFDRLFLPCGHLVACHKCSVTIKICIMCRAKVSDNIRVYT